MPAIHLPATDTKIDGVIHAAFAQKYQATFTMAFFRTCADNADIGAQEGKGTGQSARKASPPTSLLHPQGLSAWP